MRSGVCAAVFDVEVFGSENSNEVVPGKREAIGIVVKDYMKSFPMSLFIGIYLIIMQAKLTSLVSVKSKLKASSAVHRSDGWRQSFFAVAAA